MAKKESSKPEKFTPSQAAAEDAIRRALSVRRPEGGWPWDKKRAKPKNPKAR
jgi:hypothetical protein